MVDWRVRSGGGTPVRDRSPMDRRMPSVCPKLCRPSTLTPEVDFSGGERRRACGVDRSPPRERGSGLDGKDARILGQEAGVASLERAVSGVHDAPLNVLPAIREMKKPGRAQPADGSTRAQSPFSVRPKTQSMEWREERKRRRRGRPSHEGCLHVDKNRKRQPEEGETRFQ